MFRYLLEIIMSTEDHVELAEQSRAEFAESALTSVASEAVLMPVLVASLEQILVSPDGLVASRTVVGKSATGLAGFQLLLSRDSAIVSLHERRCKWPNLRWVFDVVRLLGLHSCC